MYYGDSFADLATMRLEAKIKGIYAQAYREIEEKLNTFLAKSVIKEKEYEAKVQAGKLSQEWFDRWKSGQVFIGKRWRDLRQNISEEIYNSRKSATDMINDERKAVFQDNVNYAQYTIDKDHSFGISFTLYDNATVTRLIKEDPDLVPDVKYPDPQIDYAWSKKQITSAITQGILQGESIPELAKRVGKKLQSSNEKSMVRCARTAMTGAQNSGRIQAMHNAQDMGIQVQKVWIATLDDRTRDSHRDLDGQTIGVDEPFHSLYGEIMYPADPNAAPADTWNCRCSLGYNYPKYSNQYDTRAAREVDWEEGGQTEQIPYMTYKEWTKWRKTRQLPQRGLITIQSEKPDKIEQQEKQMSGIEYFHERYKEYQGIEQLIAENESRIRRLNSEIQNLANETRDIKSKLDILDKDLSQYDNIKDRIEYENQIKEYQNRIREIQQKYANLKRPSTRNYNNEAEYEKAFKEYVLERDKIVKEKTDLEKEYHNKFKNTWAEIEEQRKLKESGIDYKRQYEEKKELLEKERKEIEKARNDRDKYNEYSVKYAIVQAAVAMEKNNVEYIAVQKTKEIEESKIIKKLAGGDLTEGSCASLAFCYAMQKNGYDVIDFRDGKSRSIMANRTREILKSFDNSENKILISAQGRYTTDSVLKVLEKVEVGKEYYLCCGTHASIVKRKEDGIFQYLELQSGKSNGWKYMGDFKDKKYIREMLKWRFGADGKQNSEAFLMDINDIAKNEDVVNLMGFINTREDEQRKGEKGHEK